MPKSQDGSIRRKQQRPDSAPAPRRAGGSGPDEPERPPELSEQGGIAPIERNPSEYHDRTRDRTLDENRTLGQS